jgi:betaine reductase
LIGKLHRYFYTTTGVATTVDAARKIGRGIAAELKREGVSAAILTAT